MENPLTPNILYNLPCSALYIRTDIHTDGDNRQIKSIIHGLFLYELPSLCYDPLTAAKQGNPMETQRGKRLTLTHMFKTRLVMSVADKSMTLTCHTGRQLRDMIAMVHLY